MTAVRVVRIAAIAILFAFQIWILSRALHPSQTMFVEDQGFLFAVGRAVLDGELPLLGPPSHIGGRHFGAQPFWFAALALAVSRGSIIGAAWIFALTNILAQALTLGLIAALLPARSRWFGVIAACAAFASGFFFESLVTPWHGYLLALPGALLLWSGWLLFSFGARVLPAFLLAATFAVQMHYGAAPLAGGLLIGWLIQARSKRSTGEEREQSVSGARMFRSGAVQTAAGFVAILFWIPPLVYELRYGSNLRELAAAMNAPGRTPAGIKEALKVCGYFFRLHLFGGRSYPVTWGGAYLWIYFLLLPLSALALHAALRDSRGTLRGRFLAVLLAIVALYIVVLARQPGPLRTYYLNSIIPIPYILLGITIASLPACIGTMRRGAAVLFLVIWGFSIGGGLLWYPRWSGARHVQRFHTLAHAEEVGAILRNADHRRPTGAAAPIIARGEAAISRNGYHYMQGRGADHLHHGAVSLRELPGFQRESVRDRGFLIVCPAPSKERRKRMWRSLRKEWRRGSTVSLRECRSCTECRMWSLRPASQ